jgi:hypothetical protein
VPLLRVNVSPAQLVTDGFVDTVADTIDEFGLAGSSVCLHHARRVEGSAYRLPSTTSEPATASCRT